MPTVPGFIVIGASALLAAAISLQSHAGLPPLAVAILGIAIPILTYVAHLQVSAATAKRLP